MTKRELNAIVYQVVGAAIEVHKYLGPGLLESTYHRCMEQELKIRGLQFKSNLVTELVYKGYSLSADLRCDLLVERVLVVELKAVEVIAPVHHAQLLTYMKLLDVPKGLLINFNSDNIFRSGQKTMVNEKYAMLPE
jgi:GxxExxY protein